MCIDGTHAVTNRNLKLLTVVVIDDFGFSMTAAFCLCAEESELYMFLFLAALSARMSA